MVINFLPCNLTTVSHTNIFLDVDECKAGLDSCPENAQCQNTIGSFSCICNNGFQKNGSVCVQG